MIICPYCHAENIEGADECERVQSAARGAEHSRARTSSVEADLLRDRIERLWPKTPSTVPPDMPVGQVLKKMVDETIGCVMVVDKRQAGRHLQRARRADEAQRRRAEVRRPADLAVHDAAAGHARNQRQDRLRPAQDERRRLPPLPILFDGKLAGVISIRDILRYLTERIAAAANVRR